MKKYAKRLLIAFLALAMVVAIVPSTVLADIVANPLRISANDIVISKPTVTVTEISEDEATLTIERSDSETAMNIIPIYKLQKKGEAAPEELTYTTNGAAAIQDGSFVQGKTKTASEVLEDLEAGTEYVVYATICFMNSDGSARYTEIVSKEFKTEEASIAAPKVTVSEISEDEATLTIERSDSETAMNIIPIYKLQKKGEAAPEELTYTTNGAAAIQDGSFVQGKTKTASEVLEDLEAGTEYVVYATICFMNSDGSARYTEIVPVEFKTEVETELDKIVEL